MRESGNLYFFSSLWDEVVKIEVEQQDFWVVNIFSFREPKTGWWRFVLELLSFNRSFRDLLKLPLPTGLCLSPCQDPCVWVRLCCSHIIFLGTVHFCYFSWGVFGLSNDVLTSLIIIWIEADVRITVKEAVLTYFICKTLLAFRNMSTIFIPMFGNSKGYLEAERTGFIHPELKQVAWHNVDLVFGGLCSCGLKLLMSLSLFYFWISQELLGTYTGLEYLCMR